MFSNFYTDFLSLINPECTLFVLSQMPKFKFNPQRVAAFNHLGFPTAVEIDSDYTEANMHIEKLITNNKNTKLLRFNDFMLFNDASCLQALSDKQDIIYLDDHHLIQVDANCYAKVAIKIIQEQLQ